MMELYLLPSELRITHVEDPVSGTWLLLDETHIRVVFIFVLTELGLLDFVFRCIRLCPPFVLSDRGLDKLYRDAQRKHIFLL